MILALLAMALRPSPASADSGGGSGAMGDLKIWVPTGIIGEEYWIYVNGNVISPRSHQRSGGSEVLAVSVPGGWEIWSSKGLILRSTPGGWDNRHDPYALSAASLNALHLFEAIDVPLPAGPYTVDLVSLSGPFPQRNSFPFALDAGWKVDLKPRQTRQLFLEIPAEYSLTPHNLAQRAYRLCSDAEKPISPTEQPWFKRNIFGFLNDPLVSALRVARIMASPGDRTVVLKLPANLGGTRKFDGLQISHMVDALEYSWRLPEKKEVEDCKQRNPEFRASYAVTEKTIAQIDNDLQSFRDFASRLQGNR